MELSVSIPTILQTSLNERSISIDARTLAEALNKLSQHPKLAHLIFDDDGSVRKHILIFHNDTATKHLDSLDIELKPGDRLAVIQAVSGG